MPLGPAKTFCVVKLMSVSSMGKVLDIICQLRSKRESGELLSLISSARGHLLNVSIICFGSEALFHYRHRIYWTGWHGQQGLYKFLITRFTMSGALLSRSRDTSSCIFFGLFSELRFKKRRICVPLLGILYYITSVQRDRQAGDICGASPAIWR